MITAKSTPEEVLGELKEGYAKAKYWHVKYYGGEKKYQEKVNELCKNNKDVSTGDVVEYIDRNGNRWRVYECARYYKEIYGSRSNTIAFVYHETFGSCGAYVVGFHKEAKNGVIVDVMDVINYTEHFFLRFCDRLKIQYKSSAMIKKFLEVCPCVTIQPREDFEGKFRKADFALPASLGRGVMKEYGNQNVFEVRTFLTNAQLSNKQRRETENLRNAARFAKSEPEDVMLKRCLDQGVEKSLEEEVERLKAVGIENAEDYVSLQMMCVLPVVNLEYIAFEDSKRYGCLVMEKLADAVYRVRSSEFRGSAPLEALRIIKSSMERLHKKVDLEKCALYIMKECYHDDTPYSGVEGSLNEYEKKIEEFDNGYLQGETDKRK